MSAQPPADQAIVGGHTAPVAAPVVSSAVAPVQILSAGSVLPDAGTLVAVPLSPATGNPGGPVVAVSVKPWYTSGTILGGLGMLGWAIVDALVNVLLPLIVSGQPINLNALWRPCLAAVFSAVIAYRRGSDNTVIGSGAATPVARVPKAGG